MAVVKFKSGAVGNIVVSNSQNPALYGKVHVFGENGAGVGVQTDGGAMFIAGMSTITEPPYNDLWTVEGEADKLEDWKKGDCDFFNSVDSMYYYHQEQIKDFLHAVETHTKPPGGRPRRPQDRGAVRGHLPQHPDQLRRQIPHPLRWAKKECCCL